MVHARPRPGRRRHAGRPVRARDAAASRAIRRSSRRAGRGRRRRGPRDDRLHLGDDRQPEGRDAQPPEHPPQRALRPGDPALRGGHAVRLVPADVAHVRAHDRVHRGRLRTRAPLLEQAQPEAGRRAREAELPGRRSAGVGDLLSGRDEPRSRSSRRSRRSSSPRRCGAAARSTASGAARVGVTLDPPAYDRAAVARGAASACGSGSSRISCTSCSREARLLEAPRGARRRAPASRSRAADRFLPTSTSSSCAPGSRSSTATASPRRRRSSASGCRSATSSARSGRRCPQTDVRIVDDDGRDVGREARGVIQIRGPQVMSGYWRNDAASNACLTADGWFDSGDLGMLSSEGDVIINGRAKDTIVLTGGENVEPENIETALARLSSHRRRRRGRPRPQDARRADRSRLRRRARRGCRRSGRIRPRRWSRIRRSTPDARPRSRGSSRRARIPQLRDRSRASATSRARSRRGRDAHRDPQEAAARDRGAPRELIAGLFE